MTRRYVRPLAGETPSIRATRIKRELPSLANWMALRMLDHVGKPCWVTLFPHPAGLEVSWGGTESQPLVIQPGVVCRLEWQRQHFGGQRLWIGCPICGRRSGRLFFVDQKAGCRVCHEVVYDTQRVTAGWRAADRAQRRRRRLGGSTNLFEPFPPRPKWMRRQRYQHLEQREQIDLSLHLAGVPLIANLVRQRVAALASSAG